MKRPQLIDTPQPWRLWSVRATLLYLLLSAVQTDVLPLVQPLVPPEHWPWVSGGFALAILVLRLVKQQLPGRDMPAEEEGPR
jgi:hypothetical protein